MSGTNARRTMKVYGWQSFRHECPIAPNGSRQTREVVAAPSVAAVLRLTGLTRAEWQYSGCETGNQTEVELALSKPGAIFWSPLRGGVAAKEEWTESTS